MKIQGIGLPFSSHQSSCSNRSPINFEWTNDDAEIEVWMDMKIPEAISVPIPKGKKRYAWFCESRAIVPQLRQAFEQDDLLKGICDSYDAIFTCEKELVDKHEKIHFCLVGSNLPWIEEENYKLYEKSKLTSFISSRKRVCVGHDIRHQLYENIKEDVDVHGSIVGTTFGYRMGCHLEGNPDKRWHDKSEALVPYRFSVVIENDKYDTYFTEKITDCFATGTIPVYYGTESIGEYFNTDGIITLNGDINDMCDTIRSLSESLYEDKFSSVKDNFERVKTLQLADDMLYDKITR